MAQLFILEQFGGNLLATFSR